MTFDRGETTLLHDPVLSSLIIENAVEYAIFTLTAEGRVASWSPGATRILGYTADEALGMDFAVLFTPSDRAADMPALELAKAMGIGRAEDSRWHLRKGGERFWGNGVSMALPAPGAGALKILRDETAAKLAEEQRVLLLNELNHRIKNTLATVQSIAEQTLRASNVDPAARRNLTDRLIALSEAHDVLVAENWAGADLQAIVDKTLMPHDASRAGPFTTDGPAVRLSPQQAVSMALVLHELATNAVKYGALSLAEGRVSVTWNLYQDVEGGRHMTLLWEETGGPPVAPPSREGFGSRLIARSLGEDGEGQAHLDFKPEGLCCTITLTLSGRDELPMLDPRKALPGR